MTALDIPLTRSGSGSRRGEPLVVLPGLSGRIGSHTGLGEWMRRAEVADYVGERDVHTIDRPFGLGRGVSIAELATHAAITIEARFHEPVDIVGVSTGGTIALQLAADYPQLVRRLVLVSSAHRMSEQGRETQRTVAQLLRTGHDRRAASLFLGTTGGGRVERALRSFTGLLVPRAVVGHGDRDLLATLDAEDGFDLEGRLRSIATRTLVTGGARDRFYSPTLFERTIMRMPNAQLHIYPRAGHLSLHRNPGLARDILAFLDEA